MKDLMRCDVCGGLAIELRPRWLDFGLRCCSVCAALSTKEAASVYRRRAR